MINLKYILEYNKNSTILHCVNLKNQVSHSSKNKKIMIPLQHIFLITTILKSPSNTVKFNQLFNDHYQQFVSFAIGYLRDEAKSQDFVSEAFSIYWEKRDALSEDTNVPGYILAIVKNKCLNYLHHKKIKLRVAQEILDHAQWILNTSINTLEACDPDAIFSDEIQQIIDKTINRLPNKTKQIFKLSRFDNLSHREIAEQLNLSSKSIEYHITKALNELRITLKDFLTILLPLFLFF